MHIIIDLQLGKTLTTGADVIAAISRSINSFGSKKNDIHADLESGQTDKIQDLSGNDVGTWSVIEKPELIKVVAFASGGLVNSVRASAPIDMDVIDFDEWECTRFDAQETPSAHYEECPEHTEAEYEDFKLQLAEALNLPEVVL